MGSHDEQLGENGKELPISKSRCLYIVNVYPKIPQKSVSINSIGKKQFFLIRPR